MKLEKFDLEKALNGAKVVTRDGLEVKQLTYFHANDNYEYHLYGIVHTFICCWTKTGEFDIDKANHDNDLFLVVEPKRIWVNVYARPSNLSVGLYIGALHPSLEDAKKSIESNMEYLKTIEITDEI